MKYARSMYRGGQPIAASVCTYESSRKLGLICPFCSQAVFFRSGFTYDRNGKLVASPDAFCHYKSDDPFSQDCELRSRSKDGEDYIRQLEVEARDQRLELYNKRLWDAFRDGYKIQTNLLKSMRRYFDEGDKRWVEKNAILCRFEFKQYTEIYQEEAWQAFNSARSEPDELQGRLINEIEDRDWADSVCADSRKRWSDVDVEIQKLILSEIVDFLATRTSGYVFQRLFETALFQLCCAWWVSEYKTRPTNQCIIRYKDEVKRQKPRYHARMIATLVGQTPWVKLFYSLDDAPEVGQHQSAIANTRRKAGSRTKLRGNHP